MSPYNVVRDFERAVAEYTGAPFCVAVNSCSAALMLAVAWHLRHRATIQNLNSPAWLANHLGDDAAKNRTLQVDRALIEIPKRTYLSVPMSIIHAGGRTTFRDEEWAGWYQLKPLPVWDSARYFTSNMYKSVMLKPGAMVCVSFQASKTLGDTQGGAILHDDLEADAWLRRARFDGRTEGVAPKNDNITQIGWHAYLSPDVAARLLLKMYSLPSHNAPLPNDEYPDLSQLEIFK